MSSEKENMEKAGSAGFIKISNPEPLGDEDDPQKKIMTNRLPKPAPKNLDATSAKSEEPITTETISLKKSELTEEEEKPRIDIEKRKLKILCYHCGQKLDLTDMEPFSEVECPSCSLKLIVPKWFENYLLEEPGGEGGMAVVYRALDLTLDREVAIKILNSSFADEADKCQLFLHEARTAATINHYAVIPIYTCGISGKTPYIVMQYMEGGALDKRLEKAGGKLPVNQVLRWIKDVADGLDNARRHGIIHHDVKPANILLDRDDNAKIGDFGIAQVLHDWRSENLAKITKSWASPNYVSPEKVLTGKEDHYGDIYSLGVSMFQLLTGQFPFDSDDIKALVAMRLQKDPPNPKELRPEIPLKISNLILSMMDRNPEKRPSYREIINEIEAHLKLKEQMRKEPEKELKSEKKSKASKKRSISPTLLSSQNGKRQQSSTLVKFAIHACIPIFMIGTFLLLWKGGILEEVFGRRGMLARTMPEDLVPQATAYFRSGDPASAVNAAKEALDSSSGTKIMKQAAIQYALGNYLLNSPNARLEALSAGERLFNYGVNEDDPAMMILRYLSNGDTQTQKLKEAFGNDDYYRALASYCLYIKSIYDSANDLEIVSYSRRCLAAGEKVPKEFWGNAWYDRIPLWKEWIEFGKGSADELEPLIAANKYEIKASATRQPKPTEKKPDSTEEPVFIPPPPPKKEDAFDLTIAKGEEKELDGMSLSSLSVEWLRNDRASFATSRPRPKNYDFNESELQQYLSSVSEGRRQNESVRARQVASMKNYLCMLMSRKAYTGEIRTSDGRTFRGTTMANPNYISVRTSKGHERIDWSLLPVEEMCKMIAHFAEARLKVSGSAGTSDAERKMHASEDYLRLALLSEWYEQYDKAVEYAMKAVSAYPQNENKVKKFMFK